MAQNYQDWEPAGWDKRGMKPKESKEKQLNIARRLGTTIVTASKCRVWMGGDEEKTMQERTRMLRAALLCTLARWRSRMKCLHFPRWTFRFVSVSRRLARRSKCLRKI